MISWFSDILGSGSTDLEPYAAAMVVFTFCVLAKFLFRGVMR